MRGKGIHLVMSTETYQWDGEVKEGHLLDELVGEVLHPPTIICFQNQPRDYLDAPLGRK